MGRSGPRHLPGAAWQYRWRPAARWYDCQRGTEGPTGESSPEDQVCVRRPPRRARPRGGRPSLLSLPRMRSGVDAGPQREETVQRAEARLPVRQHRSRPNGRRYPIVDRGGSAGPNQEPRRQAPAERKTSATERRGRRRVRRASARGCRPPRRPGTVGPVSGGRTCGRSDFGHPGGGKLGEARTAIRPMIERGRTEIGAVRPNEGVNLLIDHDLVE